MSNPLKSQGGFFPLIPLIVVGAAALIGTGIAFNDAMVKGGDSIQQSAVGERSAAGAAAATGLPGMGWGETAWSYGKQVFGGAVEVAGRILGGRTPEEREKDKAVAEVVAPGDSRWARELAEKDFDEQKNKETDKIKNLTELTDDDLKAVKADIGLIALATPAEVEAVKKGESEKGKVGAENGGASLLDKLRDGVPYANLKQGDFEKLQAACSSPLKAQGSLLVCKDKPGQGQFNAPVGKKEGQPDNAGGMGAVKGTEWTGEESGSKTRSAASTSSGGGGKNESGPKGPYYLQTTDPSKALLVDSCKNKTEPKQTDYPMAGAWGCVSKEGAALTAKDVFERELLALEKTIEELKKTDPSKVPEAEKAFQDMKKKFLLIPSVNGLPYDAKVKDSLIDMLRLSSLADCERTLKALETYKPDIQLCSSCDNTTIKLDLDADGKVTKTSLTLPETAQGQDGRLSYSSIEMAANLAESLELVNGVQDGGGALSSDAALEAQNLRESVVQSGQTVSPDQVSTQQTTTASTTDKGGATQTASSDSTVTTNSEKKTEPADPVNEETTRQHMQDQKEALNDALQGRTAKQIKEEQDKSRVALEEAEKKLWEADKVTRRIIPKPTEAELRAAFEAKKGANKIIQEQKALQKELEGQMNAQSQKYDKMVDQVVSAYSAQIERKKKAIEGNKDLSDGEKEAAKRALDKKLDDIKAHPQAYMEALGPKSSVSATNN